VKFSILFNATFLPSCCLGQAEGSSRPPPLSDCSVPSDLWYYSPSGGPVDANKTHPLPDISSTSMIGPTSTFYNPEDTSLQRDHNHDQYQQWIEGYGPQQQQAQQSHQHYPQQLEYDPSYHGGNLHAPMNPSYDFTQHQYESSSSLSQYDGSTTDTVTQSNVGHNSSSYQGQSNDLYSQVYSETIAMKQNAASTPKLTPELVNHSYSTLSNQESQQSLSHRSRQQQVHRKAPRPPQPPQPPQFQQNHAHRFLAHPNSSEIRQHASSNPSSSHSTPLTQSSIVWSNEPGYSNPEPNGNADPGAQSSLRATSTNSGSSRPSTSQNTPVTKTSPNIQLNPTTSGNSRSSPRTSPPRTNSSSFAPEKTGHKRKRVKKNEPAQWSGGGYGGAESDSDSEDDGSNLGMGGGISVGMGGLGVVGKGAGTKGSRL